MTDASLMVLLLGVISVCLMVMTVTLVVTARDVRRTLRRMHVTLTEAHQVLARTRRITRHVDAVVQKGCAVALQVLDPVLALKDRAQAFLEAHVGNHAGNGARSEPRRRH